MTTGHLIGLFFIAALIFFGFVGLARGAKWKDKQEDIYRKESDGHGGC